MPKYSQNKKKGLHKKAWSIFSKYIRFVRDKGVCYTCGVKKDPKDMDAGHYKHCDILDFDEMNINCQCVNCNRDLHGNPRSYRLKLIQQYGEDKVIELEIRSKKLIKDMIGMSVLQEAEYERIIQKYEPIIKALAI